MALDRGTVQKLHTELDTALKAVGVKFGMAIKSGTLRFTTDGISAQITGVILAANEQSDKRLDNLKPKDINNAKQLGYFGKTVTFSDLPYEIVGHNGYVLLGWDTRKQRSVRFNRAQTAQVMPQLSAPARTSFAPSGPSLTKYIEKKNIMAKFFGQKLYDANSLTAEDKKELASSLENELSPENLHMDGEASPAHVRTHEAFLRAATADLARRFTPRC